MTGYRKYSDEQLVALFKQGDEAAFKEIYLRYGRLLYLFAFKKLEDEEEAKDVVQDIFIALWNNREKFHLRSFLSGYLYKSVMNRVLKIFKHNTIKRTYADNQRLVVELNAAKTDFLIREKEVTAIVEKTISGLPPRMREIYVLRRNEHMSIRQIAERLSLSELTVSTQVKKALKHLKLRLNGKV